MVIKLLMSLLLVELQVDFQHQILLVEVEQEVLEKAKYLLTHIQIAL